MNKNIAFIVILCSWIQFSFCVKPIKSLEQMAFDSLFNPSRWSEVKDKVNQDFKQGIYSEITIFNHRNFLDVDFSNMCLRDMDFTGSTFSNCKFKNADLTGAIFDQAKFYYLSDLEGAILYRSLDDGGQPIRGLDFILKNPENHYGLVKQYSDLQSELNNLLRTDKTEKRFKSLRKTLSKLYFNLSGNVLYNSHLDKKELFQKHSEGLNTIFPALRLDLKKKNFQNFNLDSINLTHANLHIANLEGASLKNAQLNNADLYGANLQYAYLENTELEGANLSSTNLRGAYLSKSIQVPYQDLTKYLHNLDNKTQLFKLWIEGTPEEQKICQKLFNARFDIVTGIEPGKLKAGLEKKVQLGISLSNASLLRCNLAGIHLENAQLQNTNLCHADLRGAYLQNANLQKTTLIKTLFEGANLKGADLSEATLNINFPNYDCKLPPNCKDEDLLQIYKSWDDKEAKIMLKQIIIAKGIPFEELLD